MQQLITTISVLILAIIIFRIGLWVIRLIPIIKKLNLPVAVVGALIFLPFLRITEHFQDLELFLPSAFRDLLLIVFFCTLGLAVKFKTTIQGGRPLIILCLLSFTLVIFQNFLAVFVIMLFGEHPAYGLLAGSISYVGGFGSSLAWGSYYSEKGLEYALEIGFACSTFGLIFGGVLAGPAVAWLIKREGLEAQSLSKMGNNSPSEPILLTNLRPNYTNLAVGILKVIIVIGIAVYLGDFIQALLKSVELALPRFLTAMILAIILVNLFLRGKLTLPEIAVDKISDFSFNTFIILSLIGMKTTGLSNYLLPIIVILFLQIILTILFSTIIVYRAMGRNYDSAVLAGGVIGFGLSSVAVAVATVKTISNNYGSAPRALLLISLVGAALIDLPNNLLIGVLTRLEFFQVGLLP